MLGLHPAILSLNLACYTGRRGTRTSRRRTWARECLDGVSIPKSVALEVVFLAAISQESVSLAGQSLATPTTSLVRETRITFRRTSVTIPCTQFHMLNRKRYF